MKKQYITQDDSGYWIADSRVSLESVLFAFLDGYAPETIVAECFPVLSLEQVYGAITFYLGHREQIGRYLRQMEEGDKAFQQKMQDSAFALKITKARRELQIAAL